MDIKSYYLPVNATSIAHYYSRACICPTRYIENRQRDIQNKYEDALLLSLFSYTQSVECSLEIILTEAEIKSLVELSNGFYLLYKPLPITRVKQVLFRDEEKRKITCWDINDGAAFIPENITKVEYNAKEAEFVFNEENKNKEIKNWNIEIDRFNRFLGGLAFMRIGGEDYMNYSENYFSTLSYFSTEINADFQKAVDNKELHKFVKLGISDKYIGAFTGEKNWANLSKLINKKINDEDVMNFAKTEKIDLKKKFGTFSIEGINSNSQTYLLAILATYGEGRSKKIEDLILDMDNGKISKKRKEGISLIFGINIGYSSFRNKYVLKNRVITIKFTLDSLLDCYTIESVYNYAFNEQERNLRFSYLRDWCPQRNDTVDKYSFKILDKAVVAKKKAKPGSQDYLDELFQIFGSNELAARISTIISGSFSPGLINVEVLKALLEKDILISVQNIITKSAEIIIKDCDTSYNQQIEELMVKLKEREKEIESLKGEHSEKQVETTIKSGKSKKSGKSVVSEPKPEYKRKASAKSTKKNDIDNPNLFNSKEE